MAAYYKPTQASIKMPAKQEIEITMTSNIQTYNQTKISVSNNLHETQEVVPIVIVFKATLWLLMLKTSDKLMKMNNTEPITDQLNASC